jgi:hypothetical protein
MYVSPEVAEFREDCLGVEAAKEKIASMENRLHAGIVAGSGVFAPILMCEQGARKRGLDLAVAAEDARHWWTTGLVPVRSTPLASAARQEPPKPQAEPSEAKPQPGALASVEAALARGDLLPRPRAELLLKLCRLAEGMHPETFARYWPLLQDVAARLPAEERADFEAMKHTAPAAAARASGLEGEILAAVDAAAGAADSADARRRLSDAEATLTARWWWPFGRRRLWSALVEAWAAIDRGEALSRLKHLDSRTGRNLLLRWNDRAALAPGEWEKAVDALGAAPVTGVILEILERDEPVLKLSRPDVQAAADRLLDEMYPSFTEENRDEREKQSENRFERAVKLVRATAASEPEAAADVLQRLFRETARTPFFNDKWTARFNRLRQLLSQWHQLEPVRDRALPVIEKHSPEHLSAFCLAHWAAVGPLTEAEAREAWKTVAERCAKQPEESETWFLVTLLRRGLAREALAMARESARAERVTDTVRRAWLFENAGEASRHVKPEEVEDDVIARFLLQETPQRRGAFLRDLTEQGAKPLPREMWSRPELSSFVLDPEASTSRNPRRHAVEGWFKKNEPLERQFRGFVNLHGYGYYGHDELNPLLMRAIVAWGDEHPSEVGMLVGALWEEIRPRPHELSLMKLDLVRTALFDRCLAVFAAHPPQFHALFVRWLQSSLVENPIREYRPDGVYTWSLNERVAFLQSLLAAQKVAGCSARRCDEILATAIEKYPCTDELISAAAGLYASDKGLEGLGLPRPLKNPAQKEAWQLGVVRVSLKRLLMEMLVEAATTAAGTAPAAEAPEAPLVTAEPVAASSPLATLAVRFDIDRLQSAAYGLAAWKVLWHAVQPEMLASSILYEGDTAATLAHRENVFCIAIQGLDPSRLDRVQAALERSPEFLGVCATPRTQRVDGAFPEPLVGSGRVDSGGRLVEGGNAQAALTALQKEATPA